MMAQEAGTRPRLLQAAVDAMRIPDLRGKVLFTLALLAVYRFIAHVPIPGVDTAALNQQFRDDQLLGFLDLFSGGALRRLSVAALGVYPYITASIVMQLLTPVIPKLQQISREGESGRQKINRIVPLPHGPNCLSPGFRSNAVAPPSWRSREHRDEHRDPCDRYFTHGRHYIFGVDG